MSDGYQSLTFEGFEQTMRRCKAVIDALRALDRS